MSTNIFSNFSVLDELIQVIYQNIYKFVIISTVTDDRWTIYLGMSDSEGRWWKGGWNEGDVHDVLGAKASEKVLEQFADQLEAIFMGGELYISDWSPAPGAEIKLTLGPAAKKPIHIPLEEMTPSQAAEFATGIFLDIALEAQSRKCRLHGGSSVTFQGRSATVSKPNLEAGPSSFPSYGTSQNPARTSTTGTGASSSRLPDTTAPESSHSDLNKPNKRALVSEKPAVAPISRPHKGASLANPNKKARKYQAIEFESDSE